MRTRQSHPQRSAEAALANKAHLPLAAWLAHALAAVSLLLGLVLPLSSAGQALAAPDADELARVAAQSVSDAPTANFTSVVAVGDFQAELGCADTDPTCQATQLTNQAGLWTGAFGVPAGSYSVGVVATAPDGSTYQSEADQVTVNDPDTGLFVQFNAATGDIETSSVPAIAVLQTDLGTFPLAFENGHYTATINSDQGGQVNAQLLVANAPVGAPQLLTLEPGFSQISIDDQGNVTDVQPLGGATLTVTRQDGTGNPLPGGCYAVEANGQTVGRGCDADDGPDGLTTITFPGGIQPGGVTVKETTAPDGADQADDQDVELVAGPNQVTISTGGEEPATEPAEEATATEEGGVIGGLETPTGEATEAAPTEETPTETPAPQPGDFVVTLVDEQRNPVPGACFDLIADGGTSVGEQCDANDGVPLNGRVGWFGIPAGTYTLRMTLAPDGFEQVDDQQVDVVAGQETDQNVSITASATATSEPTATEATTATTEPTATETPTDVPTEIPTEVPTEAPTETASETPTDESVIGVLPTQETATETPAETATTEATATEAATATEEALPGDLIVTLVDGQGQPVPGACFQLLREGNVVAEACDTNDAVPNNGNSGFFGVPAGNYMLHLSQAPDGVTADDQDITIKGGQETDVTVTATIAETPTAEATATEQATATEEATATGEPTQSLAPPAGDRSAVQVTFDPTSGQQVCIELGTTGGIGLINAPAACDNGDGDADPAEGSILLQGVPEGDWVVTVTQGPDTLINAPQQTVTVSNGQTASASFQAEPTAVPATETPQPTATNTPEPTATNTPEPTATNTPEPTATNTPEPTATNTPEPTATNTPAPTATSTPQPTATPTETPVVVSVDVVTEDNAGNPVGGACYTVDDGDRVCDEDNDGLVTFESVTPGDHTFAPATTPDGYQTPSEQTVDVPESDPAARSASAFTVTFQLAPETGTLVISFEDADGNPLSNVCLSVDKGEQQCDNDPSDANADVGVVQLSTVPVGEHTVAVTDVPDGYDLPESPESATVPANDTATVTFQINQTPPANGALDVTVTMQGGDPIAGVCVTLASADQTVIGPYCDGQGGDTNADDGVIGIAEVPAGTYSVALADDTEIDGGDVANANSPSVVVTGGGTSTATISVPPLPTTGTLRIVTANSGRNIGGACYTVNGPDQADVCDNGANDANGTTGVIDLADVPASDYTVTMTTPPDGYQTAADASVTVTAGALASVTINVAPVPQPGTVRVTKVDGNGDALGGACFALQRGGVTVDTQCDETDASPNDGVLEFNSLDAGTYTLVETRTPGVEYSRAANRAIRVTAGGTTEVEVVNTIKTGQLSVITVAAEKRDQRLNNACYRLEGERTYGQFCDGDDGSVDGRVVFVNVPAGDYTLIETVAPTGYVAANDSTVTIQPGGSRQVTIANERKPIPEQAGLLVVIPRAPNGQEVAGGCYQLYQGDQAVTGVVCDNADTIDKRIIFRDMAPGTYTVVEGLAPSPDYRIADKVTVQVSANQRTNAFIKHSLKSGRVLIQAENSTGQALPNACFTLDVDGVEPTCSGTSGDVNFDNIPAGSVQLTQTQAPYGYKLDKTPKAIDVRPGQTTVVTVVFIAAPPPDTGSVQIQKFVCPAGEEGERTSFLGGAQGNAQLARTAGCVPARAEFTLTAENGSSDGPGAVSTDAGGRYQVTLRQGIYVLTETNPDLQGTSSARLRVGVGQMTTVIVINYVAPPKPAPATIDVTASTCPPSFNGTTYADFQANCTGETSPTNNITVRADGASRYRQVTGDKGTAGATSFADLPAGTYTVYAEKPYDIPLMYMFCGPNANAPADIKVINGSASLTLVSGQEATCEVFLIPEQIGAQTGAILVQKYSCPITKPVKGYAWQEECSRSTRGLTFDLTMYDTTAKAFPEQPTLTVTANPDGIVRFPNLPPGTYKLEETDGRWCFAQSDSVNSAGNVVVNANNLSQVWIYNCDGTTQPPNTGSGDAARLLNPADDDPSGVGVLLNLAWPLLAGVAWIGWRSRRSISPVTEHRSA